MKSNRIFWLFVFLNLLAAGCRITLQTEIPAATPPLITATLPPLPTPRPTETASPTALPPTPAPVLGVTATRLNVRAEPSTAGQVLGILPPNVTVQIVGQDAGGTWWQILYEAGEGGKGWVTAQYVQTAARPEVPVIGGVEEGAGSAVVIQPINVRSGPGTAFNSLGLLNPNDSVRLTGKNQDGTWLQIAFSGAPNGQGWVNAAFVRAQGVEQLPVVADSGTVIGTATPVDTPLPPSPTILPAPLDSDSAAAPLKTILFERDGIQTVIYNGEVSSPAGDAEDWIAFTPYDRFVFISLQCSGNGALLVEIGTDRLTFSCNETERAIPVTPGVAHLVHLQAVPSSGTLQTVNYTLRIKARP